MHMMLSLVLINRLFVPQGLLEGDLAKRAYHFFSENARVFAGRFLNIIVMHILQNTIALITDSKRHLCIYFFNRLHMRLSWGRDRSLVSWKSIRIWSVDVAVRLEFDL